MRLLALEVVLKVNLAVDGSFFLCSRIIEQQSSFSHLVLFFAILNSSFDKSNTVTINYFTIFL